jgi:hypothetical protein
MSEGAILDHRWNFLKRKSSIIKYLLSAIMCV